MPWAMRSMVDWSAVSPRWRSYSRNDRDPSMYLNKVTFKLGVFHHPLLAATPASLSRPLLTMPRQTTAAGSIVLSNSTAFVMCDGLLRMSHCLIVELPEPELREIRYILDTLLVKTDLVLDSMERDISFNLEGLSIDSGEPFVLCPSLSDVFQISPPPLRPKTSARSWFLLPSRQTLLNRILLPQLAAGVPLTLPWPLLRHHLPPPFLHRPQFLFVPLLRFQSPSQFPSHPRPTAVILSSFPLEITLGSLTILITPTSYAQVCLKFDSQGMYLIPV